MKIWEAIQMLEQMDHTKECIVTFGAAKVAKVPNVPHREWVINRQDWLNRTHGMEEGQQVH